MDRLDLRTLQSLILNFNPSGTDQDYTTAQANQGLQEAYNDEVILVSENGLLDHLKSYHEFTWTSSLVTLELASTLKSKLLIELRDITDSSVGDRIIFAGYGFGGDVFWKDKTTMQWSTTGPSSDRTIRATFIAVAETLQDDTSVPQLIPVQFHPLLAWGGAAWLKDLAEESYPVSWEKRIQRMRESLWKFMSRGKPISDPPRVRNLGTQGVF